MRGLTVVVFRGLRLGTVDLCASIERVVEVTVRPTYRMRVMCNPFRRAFIDHGNDGTVVFDLVISSWRARPVSLNVQVQVSTNCKLFNFAVFGVVALQETCRLPSTRPVPKSRSKTLPQ